VKKLYHSRLDNISLVAKDTYVLSFENGEMSRSVSAGQFIEVKVPHCAEILWRRPFSIHDVDPDNGLVRVLFHAIGRGTFALTVLEKNCELDVLGPLGNSFSFDNEVQEVLVVAGGLGIAPFMLLKRQLEQLDIPMRIFYGVASREQFCGLDQLGEYATLHLSTDDGSLGHHGLVTEMLTDYLDSNSNLQSKKIVSCGPTPMMQTVKNIAQKYDIPAQVSLETIMACGFGACVGCAVPMTKPDPGKKEYYLACKDGPVFDINEIIIDD
jgi:dihydroorotate dehydrogenase electron transfer subunit